MTNDQPAAPATDWSLGLGHWSFVGHWGLVIGIWDRLRPLTLLALLFLSSGCSTGPAPDRAFVQQADRLHEQALAPAVVRDPLLAEYVQAVGDRLAEAAKQAVPGRAGNEFFRRVQFHVVDSDTVNVFPTGGSHVYVYRGLLRLCGSEEELATALAHAYAHTVNLDVQGTEMRPDPGRAPRLVVWDFVTNRFTGPQERAADQLAFMLYVQAGYDPKQFGDLFTRLEDRPVYGPRSPDRPPLDTRAATEGGFAKEVPREWRQPPVADRQTYQTMRRQAATGAAAAGSGAPLSNAQLFLAAFPNCLLEADEPEQRAAQEQLRPPPPQEVPLEPS